MKVLTPSLVVFSAAFAFTMPCCDGPGGIFRPGNAAWVATEPTQCLTNPWERDWLARHGNNYSAYPADPDAQEAIIEEYYMRLGIEIEAVVSVPRFETVCLACSCPRGDTLYLLVDDDDADAMVGLGYRREEPGWFGSRGDT